MESFHENTSEDLEWFSTMSSSHHEAYAERNGLVLSLRPGPVPQGSAGIQLAAKARCQLSGKPHILVAWQALPRLRHKTTEKPWPVEEGWNACADMYPWSRVLG